MCMASPHEYIVTKAGPLIIRSCNTYMLCMVLNSQQPHHNNPRGNAYCERFNRTNDRLINIAIKGAEGQLPLHLPSLVFAYNAAPHSTTGYQPYELMFGRKAPTICNAWLRLAEYNDKFSQSKCEWVNQHHELILAANRHALKRIKQSARKISIPGKRQGPRNTNGQFGIIA